MSGSQEDEFASDPERSITSITLTSRRVAVAVTLMVVNVPAKLLNQRKNMCGARTDGEITTVRIAFALLIVTLGVGTFKVFEFR